MRKWAAGGVLLAGLLAGQAKAADVAIMGGGAALEPVPTLAWAWTSWYVGGFVGASWTRADAFTTDACGGFVALAPGSCWLTPLGGEVVSYPMSSGFIGGASAGYNYQIPGTAIVFGLETQFGALRSHGSSSFASVSAAANAPFLVATATTGPWYNATTARVGWTWDRILAYGKAGFAISTLEATIADTRGGFATASAKKDVLGWAWGMGAEWAFSDRWSVAAEYLWLGLNHSVEVCSQAPFVAPAVASGNLCSTTTFPAVQTFKVGVNYLLNAGPVFSRY
jgi:outer membrane immunogenic protein